MSDHELAMATSAPWVARIRGLVQWVGAGRALTQTGRLRRADALELVELLDTGDVLDPRFPIQSSTELYRLTLLVEWAKVCGLVRVVRGRIVTVRKHAGLLERPLDLVECMLAGMPRLGDALGHSVVVADGAHTVEAVFGDLVGHGGRLSLERACDVGWCTAMSRYWFPEATELQMQFQRRRSDGDVARILDAAAGLGVLTVVDGEIALTALGSSSVRAWLGLGRPDSDVLCVRVALRDSGDPSVWRRLRVPADIRLDRFHLVLCAAMGWQDSHLHVFERGPERYGFPDPDLDIRDDREVTLSALLVRPGDRLDYEYDFGDGWQHDVVLEAVEGGNHDGPRCTGGAGRCPPEDVGGIPGYEDLRRVLAAPDEAGHAEALEWLGLEHALDFDPAAFDVERANDAVARALVARSV
jgi:hypothetical protein